MDVIEVASLQDITTLCDTNTSQTMQESSVAVLSDEVASPWNSIGESLPRTQNSIPVVNMIFSQPLYLYEHMEKV
jgi:hypothetical protein